MKISGNCPRNDEGSARGCRRANHGVAGWFEMKWCIIEGWVVKTRAIDLNHTFIMKISGKNVLGMIKFIRGMPRGQPHIAMVA